MSLPEFVNIVEVGPRDGLQNERKIVPTACKLQFIEHLAASGLSTIETTSFVSPQWVPQMADSQQVMQQLSRHPTINYPVLVPNLKGLERALSCEIDTIAIFASASEAFSQRNINCSIAESIERFKPVIERARAQQIKVRAYISCVLGCPYEGEIETKQVVNLAQLLHQLGCYEISLGDTIGVGTVGKVQTLIQAIKNVIPQDAIACHFHNTYGQALTNIFAALQLGIHTFDSSVSGLGGCPYAKGASGNVATEDLLYLLQGLGIKTGVDLHKLIDAGKYINRVLRRRPQSNVAIALG